MHLNYKVFSAQIQKTSIRQGLDKFRGQRKLLPVRDKLSVRAPESKKRRDLELKSAIQLLHFVGLLLAGKFDDAEIGGVRTGRELVLRERDAQGSWEKAMLLFPWDRTNNFQSDFILDKITQAQLILDMAISTHLPLWSTFPLTFHCGLPVQALQQLQAQFRTTDSSFDQSLGDLIIKV